jgi:hypothetical protein
MGVATTGRLLGVLALATLLGLWGCTPTVHAPPRDPDLTIKLRWIKNYPTESKDNVNTGLYWTLSFLGAKLPPEAEVLRWEGDVVTVDLDAAAVPDGVRAAWKRLLGLLKASAEYQRMGGIDAGRFVLLTLCSANHYYALTGANPRYDAFRAVHKFDPMQVAITKSGVARGNRLIEVEHGGTIRTTAFVAYEGTGSISDRTFQKAEIETLDFMDNGQLRFALYDLNGHLKAHTTPSLTTAGKPSKCLWCHEIRLLPPGRNMTDVPGYLPTKEFVALVEKLMHTVDDYRGGLSSKVYFQHLDDHSYAEDLYLFFAEPTAARLAAEWAMPLEDVRHRLQAQGLQPHAAKDLSFMGGEFAGNNMYRRADVDPLAPYEVVRGPADSREPSEDEPDLLN